MLIYYCGILQEAYNSLNTDEGRKQYIELINRNKSAKEKQFNMIESLITSKRPLKTVVTGKGNVAKNLVEVPRKPHGHNIIHLNENLTLEYLSTIFYFNGIYKTNIDKYLLTIKDEDSNEEYELYGKIIVPYIKKEIFYPETLIKAIHQNIPKDKNYMYIGSIEKVSGKYILHKNIGDELAIIQLSLLKDKDVKKSNDSRTS